MQHRKYVTCCSFWIFEKTEARRVIDRSQDAMAPKGRELQRRQDEHGITLFRANVREQFEREFIAFKCSNQRGVERQSFEVLRRERKMIVLSRVVEVELVHRSARNSRLR